MQSWKRTYWAVWWANAITAAGMMSFLPFFPGHLQDLGVEDRDAIAAWSGAIYGAAPLVAACMSPLWGSLGDRFGRRLMVVRAMLAITVFVGAMAFATEPVHLLLLRVGQGFFAGFMAPSMTLVSISAPPEQHGRISGSLQSAMAVGAVIGPLLGAVFADEVGMRQLFLWVASASAVSALLVVTLAREDAAQRRDSSGGVSVAEVLYGTWEDITDVLRNRSLRSGLLLLFWIQFGLGATNPLLELHVADITELGPARSARYTGALFSVMAVVNVIAMPLWGRYGDRVGHSKALMRCAIGCGAALLLHAVAPAYGVLFAARFALGAFMAGSGPCAFGLAAAEISADRRGGAFGVVFSARAFSVAIAAMIGGALSQFVGIRGLFVLGGACVFAAALYGRGAGEAED